MSDPSDIEPPSQVSYGLDAALDLLAALEDARDALTDSGHLTVVIEAMYERRVPRVRLPDGTLGIPADSLHLIDIDAGGS